MTDYQNPKALLIYLLWMNRHPIRMMSILGTIPH